MRKNRKGILKMLGLSLGLTVASAFGAAAGEVISEEAATETVVTEECAVEGVLPAAFFTEGPWEDLTVGSMEDVSALILKMQSEITQNELVHFEPWRELTDTAGNHYYVFIQMYDSVTVSGGAVKVVTDPDGRVRTAGPSEWLRHPDIQSRS